MNSARRNALARAAALLATLIAAVSCGSSTSTSTAPSPITRCAIALNTTSATVPAAGGSGAVAVSATRDCEWSASVEGGWLSIKSNANGQGEGTVEFAATPNPDPQPRTGAILVNGTRAEITQSAGACVITLNDSSANFPPEGGTARIDVRASSQLCTWTATTDAPWIEITSGASGRGNESVTISVAPATGPPRAGALTIGGQRYSVTQSQGCTYAIDRMTHGVGAGGGAGTVMVTTADACPWTAASNVEWITVNPPTGTGPAPVTFSVAPTEGPERTGTAVIAGHLFTVTQSAGCAYQVSPTSHSVGASGGTATATVSTAAGCSWTAASNTPWITIQGPTSGDGSGTVTFAVAATTGPARSGTLTVAGQQVSVSQTQGCTFAISPQNQSVPSSGGTGTVTVTAGAGCAWTAKSNASWVTISSGGSGSGNGAVQFRVASTTGPARSTTLTVAGQTFTINQGQGCSFRLSPSSVNVDDDGGQRSFEVETASGCGWTASTSTPWIRITAGASGSGTGTVRFSVSANAGPGRTGSITAGDQTFTVNQGQGCSFRLSPSSVNIDDGGGERSFDVETAAGCGWAASTSTPWITLNSGATGQGSGTVRFTVAANAGPSRTGTITAAGQTFTVTQGTGCNYALSPETGTVPAAGGSGTVNVTAGNGCSWTANSNAPWLTITSGGNGTGNGTVGFTAAANPGAARTGTLTVAGRTFTVEQAAACTYSINPTQHGMPGSGGTVDVSVSAPGGCTWTSMSHVPWITVTSGASGTGDGVVRLTVEPNGGGSRNGTVTIAGRTFTVEQGSGCVYSISPTSQAVPVTGGGVTVGVTTQGSCGWTAASNAPWIAVTSGSTGSGNGTVELTVDPNTGAARTGTATIAGETFTVTQESACTFVVTPETIASPAAGRDARVEVSTTESCAWTAASNAPWIAVTAGSAGTGSGAVDVAVAANSGPARSGTLSVAGRTVTVSQESGCTIAIAPTDQTIPAGGGAGSVNVTAGTGCPWTAVSSAPWIAVTAGASGSGDGVVQFAVEANPTGAPRTGTIAIGGQTFTVNQQ